MVTKPISQIIAVSDEDGTVRLKVNPDGSINVTTTGGGTTPEMNIAEVGGVTVPAYGAAFPTSGLPVAFISSAGSTMQPAVVSSSGAQRMDLFEIGDSPLVADDAAAGTTFPVPVGGIFNTTKPTYTSGDRAQWQANANGELAVLNSVLSASGADGSSNTLGFMNGSGTSHSNMRMVAVAGNLFNGTTWDRNRIPNTTARLPSSAATTNATSAKASTGWLFNLIGFNTNAAVRYLKIYNKATAPTVGTDTPVLTIPLVPSAGFSLDFAKPIYFTLGIGYALTTGSADADTGAVGAGDIVGLNLVFA